ncbi:MAG: glutathione S-transferase [Paracoccaceae bacterium]
MSLRLRYAKASPFVRKVMVALHETGLIDRTTLEEGASSPLDPNPDNVALNPLGKIPCLVTEEGLALYDSRVICRWIDAEAGGGLYPTGAALWPALTLEATADGIMEAGLLVVYESRFRPEPMRMGDWVEGQRRKILSACDMLEAEAATRLEGSADMGRLAIACALGYVDFRLPDLGWRDGRPALAAWAEGVMARPSLAATAPE